MDQTEFCGYFHGAICVIHVFRVQKRLLEATLRKPMPQLTIYGFLKKA